MRRGSKPAKQAVARTSRENEGSSVGDLEKRLAEALKREAEALEQQRATAEILRVIRSCQTDAQPVFDAIARSAVSLCNAAFGAVYRYDRGLVRPAAHHNFPAEALAAFQRIYPAPPSREAFMAWAILDRAIVHIPDIEQDPRVSEKARAVSRALGARSFLGVPMMHDGTPIGVIGLAKREATAFTDTQVALLETFADQAVIAIENVRLFQELQERNRELAEGLEQQTATGEVLRAISSSPTSVQPVFDTILANALRLCEAHNGGIFTFDGQGFRMAATAELSGDFLAYLREAVILPGTETPLRRVGLEPRVSHVADILADPSFSPPEVYRREGMRTSLAVPILKEGRLVGAFAFHRRHVRPFTDKQIQLLETFADQAAIAIENVRLFQELEARNRDLTQALDQQTATSEILRGISSAHTDAQPVFDTIVRSAARLCNAATAAVFLVEGGMLYHPANHGGAPEALAAARARYPRPVGMDTAPGHAIVARSPVQIPDVEDPSAPTLAREAGRMLGFRSCVAVPMLATGEAVGAIVVTRRTPGLFSDAEVELLRTFSDQAVIAIENVRLFTELQEKNRALSAAHARVTDALEQQTATGEILRVISSSPTDVQPVFAAVAANAARLCDAFDATIFQVDMDELRVAAHEGPIPAHPVGQGPSLSRGTPAGRAVLDRRTIHVADVQAEIDEYPEGSANARRFGHRSVLVVPLLRAGEAIGAIAVRRAEVRPFNDNQIELLKTFADQAVIAIENVHLFKELEARTGALTRSVEQLTALGEVGRAVSSTLDLETVLTTIVARAVELSRLDGGVVFEYDEDAEEFVQRAATETGGALAEARRATRIPKGEGVLGRTAITPEPVQVPDITVAGAYESRLRDNLIESGIRAILAVPMVCEGRLIGCLGVTRNRSGEFPPETIDLLRTFATQSALAIQNARLYRELEQKSRELEAASRHKSEFLANMSHELRTPLNAIIGFSEVLAERMFGDVNEKQAEYLHDILDSGRHLLSLINDILDLSKVEAGRLELQLGRFHLPTALDNALILVRERASRHGIALEVSVDENLGEIVGDERKIRQILLNLLSNAVKFTPEGGRVEVIAAATDGVITISVSDTGIGIAPQDQAGIFEEFCQVGRDDARKQEGTGLGLTLAKKFVELHGGRIWVRSQVGQGSTFTFTLPVRPEGRSPSDQGRGAPTLSS